MFKKLDSFGCFVMEQNGRLYKCSILPDGGVDQTFGQINWVEVKTPDQDFLNAANEALNTSFSIKDFAIRKKERSNR